MADRPPQVDTMPSKEKENAAPDGRIDEDFDLPFSLYLSFAEVAGIGLKPCGLDGQPLPGAPEFSLAGPCAALCKDGRFSSACAAAHAGIVKTVIELRRPNIFNCHMRLAAWAVPILHEGRPLPAAIICGGALLAEPDAALSAHLERTAERHGVDPAELVRSLDSVPVLSRERMRTIADFLFRMSAALISAASPEEAPGADAAVDAPGDAAAAPPPVFHPKRRKETKKARLKRARAIERQSLETEIVRLLMERRPDAALEMLITTLTENGGARAAANLAAAETFTRLFRMLAEGCEVPRGIADKQSLLVAEILSRKSAAGTREAIARSCREFVSLAEEMTGGPRPRRVKAIQRFLEKNFPKKLTLGTVGKKFDMKEKALDVLMRKHFGMGFTDYVASLRVSDAKRLLLSTDLNMARIAHQTGFKDQSYFTKVFKSRIGSTPTEFRKAKRK